MRVPGTASLAILVATGCSATVVDGVDEAEGIDAGAQGNVSVEQVVSHGASGPSMRTRVSARFVRVSGSMDQQEAERVVGTAPPRSQGQSASYGCSWEDVATESAPATASDGSIELLDVGDIVLRAGAEIMPLAARAFPDVGDLVSGVVYTSRGGDSALPLAGSYLIETSGSAFVDGFTMQVEAPDAPSGVKLLQGGDAYALDANEILIDAQQGLTLTWDSPREALDGDAVLVEIADVEDAGSLVCVFEDVGAGHIPASQLALPVAGSVGGELDLSVHRQRRVALDASQLDSRQLDAVQARGIDGAVVDFDFAVTARATVE